MIREYISKALENANYEILREDQTFYGEIPVCQGVYANCDTLEKCRKELEEVLEEWLLLRIYKNLPIPEIDGVSLSIKEESAA